MGTLHKRTHRPLALGALFLLLGVVGWHLPQLGSAVMAYSNHAFKTARAAISKAPAVKTETSTPQAATSAMTPTAPMQQTPAQQNLAAAQAALDSARANEKADPTKANAQNVDSALATYNAAAAARVAEIKSILNGAGSSAGNTGQDSGSSSLPANYNALVAELKTLGGLPLLNAPAPNITPEVEPNSTAGTAQTLNLATQNVTIVGGSITAADQDWFKINVGANSRAWLYVDTGGTQVGGTTRDSQLTLFQSDGTTQIEFDDDDYNGNGCDGTNETGLASGIGGRVLSASGDYLIKINAFNMTTGVINPYKLFVVVTTTAPAAETEPNNDSAAANTIVTGAQSVGLRSGTLTAGDLDFYSVVATAGNVVYINADGDPERNNTGTDLVVELRDTNGTTILFSGDSSITGSAANPVGEGFCFTIPATGTYFVVVRHFSATGTGNYDLMVAAANSDTVGGGVCPPNPISSSLGTAGGNFAKVTGSVTQRYFRDGVVSACGVPRTQAAPIAATRTYDAYTIPVGGAGTVCVTVQLTVLEQAASNYMVAAHLNSFNPANLTANWLGDPGLSSGIPPLFRSFTVNVPAGNNLVIVVLNTNATGDGGAYELNVFGLPGCTTPPCGLTPPSNIVVSNAANQCGATVTYPAPGTSGVCNPVTCTPPSGSFFPVGTTTVTCTSTGNSNGNVSVSFTVTVNDTQPPAITCPPNQFVGTTGSSQVVNYPAPTVSDNCPGIQAAICTPPSGSSFPLGVTTVTCSVKDAVNNMASCSFQVTVNKLTVGAITDPLACTGPGNVLNGSFSVTNNGNVAQSVTATVALTSSTTAGQLLALPGTCVASVGTCNVVNATTISYSGNLTAGQVATISYKLQVNDVAPTGTVLTSTVTASFNGGPAVQGSASTTVTCQQVGPGQIHPARAEVSDQKAGSVLVFPIYTSSVAQSSQNSRIAITNTHPNLRAWVHLFFVADNCSVSDAFLCLTPNQTSTFLASDLDPGTTGYLVAIASDGVFGCPINFNYLIGDEYVKFSSGHAANLGAESISAIAGSAFWASCNSNSISATLQFDGISYNMLPNVVSVDNIGSRADGNDTLVVLNRINGDLRTGPTGLGNVFGVFYDDAENALSFTLNSSACQFRFRVDNSTPRITPRFDQFIGAGRSGWIKMYQRDGHAILGSAINFNPNTGASAGAFTGGHNLHHLTLTNTASYIIPIFPPSC